MPTINNDITRDASGRTRVRTRVRAHPGEVVLGFGSEAYEFALRPGEEGEVGYALGPPPDVAAALAAPAPAAAPAPPPASAAQSRLDAAERRQVHLGNGGRSEEAALEVALEASLAAPAAPAAPAAGGRVKKTPKEGDEVVEVESQ